MCAWLSPLPSLDMPYSIAILPNLPPAHAVLSAVSLQVTGGVTTVCPGDPVVLTCAVSANDTATTALRWNSGTTAEKTYLPGDTLNNVSTISTSYQYTLISANPMVSTMRITSVQADSTLQCTSTYSNMASSSATTIIKLASTFQTYISYMCPSFCFIIIIIIYLFLLSCTWNRYGHTFKLWA